MTSKKFFKIIPLLALCVLALTGCSSKLAGLELPPLPTATEAVQTPVPTYVPKVTPTPSPTPSPTPTPSADPSPTPTPTPAAETAAPTAAPKSSGPKITVEDMTLPEDMLEYNIATLRGWIYTDSGLITEVYASITDSTGHITQDTRYCPYEMNFSLAGTVNADLAFAHLPTGTYEYKVVVTVNDDVKDYTETVASTKFTVYAQEQAAKLYGASTASAYSAKYSTETTNEALIWNYFLENLGNPHGAAAVLANMQAESVCTPVRVSGDTSAECSFSKNYTELVDGGNVNRDSFIQAVAGEGYGNGYGLCQWSGERKAGLYDLAKKQEMSVGNLILQCEYVMQELNTDYPALLEYLVGATDYAAATREFCYVFEQAQATGSRVTFAKSYLDQYAV